jgi:hypothetical protein
MDDMIKPPLTSAPVPDRSARNDAEAARDEGKPGTDENAAGFLKRVVDKPVKE